MCGWEFVNIRGIPKLTEKIPMYEDVPERIPPEPS